MRLHPAASRVAKLARETPASFVAFDAARRRRRGPARASRRTSAARASSGCWRGARPPIHLTPMTRDRALAAEWLTRFEGAGLDGVIAKPVDGTYQPGKRAMLKIKHARTADCVVAGFRWHKAGPGELVGSLLLGLYDDQRPAAPRRRHLVVHDGDAARSWRRSSRRCASARSTTIRGASGPRRWATARRACPAARAAGAPARTCRGSRCASSACAR